MANYPLRYSDFTHAGRKDTSIGYSNQGKVTSGIAVANPSPVPGADHYLELSFSGTLAPQGDPATNDQFNIHVTLHTSSYQGAVDVSNDYSYDGGAAGVYEPKIPSTRAASSSGA